jgi:hypothetical protein
MSWEGDLSTEYWVLSTESLGFAVAWTTEAAVATCVVDYWGKGSFLDDAKYFPLGMWGAWI